jgi:hypothetical protein
MKYLFFPIAIFILGSCASKKENSTTTIADNKVVDSFVTSKTPDTVPQIDSFISKPEAAKQELPKKVNEHPGDGKYRYDMAFAEYQGKTMGEKVTVIIKGDSIKIVYEGDGKLTATKGTILDQGIIVKHKSGVWIIAKSKKDAELDVFGGCSGGPAVIDFIHKKYITC